MSDVQLHLGDCLIIVPKLLGAKIDAVIADPPYGINLDTNYSRYPNGKQRSAIRGDEQPFDFSFWRDFPAREQFWFGAENYVNLPMPSNNWLCWDKYPTDKSDGRLSGQFELIWSKKRHKRILLRVKAINTSWITVRESVGYATQKPVELLVRIIEKFTKPGDTILDPYMGSGTTGVACMQTGRNFIGIEIDPERYMMADTRIAKAKKMTLEAAA